MNNLHKLKKVEKEKKIDTYTVHIVTDKLEK